MRHYALNKKMKFLILIVLVAVSMPSLAQRGSSMAKPEWRLVSFIETRYDNNATREEPNTPDDQKIMEQQNFASLTLMGVYRGNKNAYSINYRTLTEHFTQNTQESGSDLFGSTSYTLGNTNTYYGLELGHSLDRVLTTPDAEALSVNSSNQQTYTASPILKTRESRPNSFRVSGIFSRVDHEDSERPDSVNEGYALEWRHRLPRIYQFRLIHTNTETGFDKVPALDYKDKRFELVISAITRKLEYEILVGQQTTSMINSPIERTDDVYSAMFTYVYPGSSFRFIDTREISHSTFTGTIADASSGISLGGSGGVSEQDLVVLNSRELIWTTETLCGSCSLNLNISQQERRYFTQPQNDYRALISGVSLGYDTSPKGRFTLGLSIRNISFIEESSRQTKHKMVDIGYERLIMKDTLLRGFLSFIDRDSTDDPYFSNRLGLRLVKEFE